MQRQCNVPMWQLSVPNAATFECSLTVLVKSISRLASQCNANVFQRANVANQRAKCGKCTVMSHSPRYTGSLALQVNAMSMYSSVPNAANYHVNGSGCSSQYLK